MAKISVEYFALDDFNTVVGSTILRLTPDNKLPVFALKNKFNLLTVEEIEDGVAVGIGFDKHGDSHNPFVPNSMVKITGEPKGIMLAQFYQ